LGPTPTPTPTPTPMCDNFINFFNYKKY